MGQAYSLSRFVLRTCTPKKVKNALMVPGIDTAAVVGDLENRKAQFGAAPDGDVAGNPRLEIFERVIDQVRENLLQRQAIAGDLRQRLDANPGLRLGSLVRHGRDDGLDQFARVDP